MTPTPAARVLVVEDERIVALNLQDKLTAMGYAVVALAGSGEQAVALATEHRPHLVLMDIRLRGEMDGIRAAEVVRDRLAIPVVFLTAYSTRDVVERAKVTEPFGYVLKPVADRELQVVIEVALYRHRAQRQLVAQKNLIAATLQSIGDGVVATDADGRVTFVNAAAERLIGRAAGACIGRPLAAALAVTDEGTGAATEVPLLRAIRTCAVQTALAHVLRRSDGAAVPIESTAAPILDETGAAVGGVLVFRDVTERRAHLRQIATLAAVVAASQDALIGFDADGTIVSWNPAAERLFGYAATEAVGQKTTIFIPPDDHERVWANHHRLAAGGSVAPYEAVRRRKDGSTFDASVSLSAVPAGPGGGPYLAAIRDVTHLRQLEAQFRQSQKMEAIGLLAGGVAHDFNNLLTVIGGYGRLLLQEPLTPDQTAMAQEIWEAGERAATLTRQLLAFGRKQILTPEVVDPNEAVARSGRLLRRLIGEDVEVVLALDPAADAVRVDPAQLEQALVNLAVNARDAMPTGGRLVVSTGNAEVAGPHPFVAPGRYVRLAVADTGCGMADDVRARVFEPFFTTKPVGKGTGLGLSMVYGFVKQSGGYITVESKVGAGTTFELLLQRADDPEPTTAPADVPPPRARPGDAVLLAEDDDGVRRYAAGALRGLGYAVLEATDGADAMRVADGHDGPIHLLLTDVVMPGVGGRPLAEALSARRPGLRVLYTSGYTDDTLLRHGVSNGTDDFLHKPFTTAALGRAVHRAVAAEPRAGQPDDRP